MKTTEPIIPEDTIDVSTGGSLSPLFLFLVVALLSCVLCYTYTKKQTPANKIIFVQQNCTGCNPRQYDNAVWEQINDSTIIKINK